MKQACLLLITLFFLAHPAQALLRAPKPARTEQAGAAPEQKQQEHEQSLFSISPFREKHRARDNRLNPVDRYNVTTPGIFSFVCAMLGLAFIAGVGITSFSMLVIPVFAFATLAAVFGAVGIKRHKPGYAIIGLVLGMMEIIGGFLLLALLL